MTFDRDEPNGTPDSNAAPAGDHLTTAFQNLFERAGQKVLTEAAPQVRVWVANDGPDASEYGRIMLSREAAAFDGQLTGVIDQDSPLLTANVSIKSGSAANDNVIWVGSDDEDDNQLGVYGRDPSAATLPNGDTVVAWIGEDTIVHAKLVSGASTLSASDKTAAPADGRLNALLADLGSAAAQAGGKAGRVAITSLGESGFAAVWTCEFALTSVLMGQIFVLAPAAAHDATARGGGHSAWSVRDLGAHTIPHKDVAFSIHGSHAGTVAVSFHSDSNGGADAATVVLGIAGTDDLPLSLNSGNHEGSNHSISYATVTHAENGAAGRDDSSDDSEAPAQPAANPAAADRDHSASASPHHSDVPATSDETVIVSESFTIAGGNTDTVQQIAPKVTVSDDGHPTELHVVPHGSPGSPAQIFITPLNEHGQANGPSAEVTDNALVSDPDRPELDLSPDLTGTQHGVAVVWVEHPGSDSNAAARLAVQAFDGNGEPLSNQFVSVAVAEAAGATFSGLSVGFAEADSGGDGVLGVVWVQNADANGYGCIDVQMFSVPNDDDQALQETGQETGSGGLVALGEDGISGRDDDAPFQLTSDGDGVVGRSPQVEGLEHGQLAIAWVEEREAWHGNGVIHGVILIPGQPDQSVELDLSAYMPNGIAPGTDPVLTSDDAGDIIIGWIQSALSGGGYEAAAAIYRSQGHGNWLAPATAAILSHFDAPPRDLAIAVSGHGDDLSLVVAWHDEANGVSAVRYDIGEGQAGDVFSVHTDSGQDDGGGLGLADLGHGQVLIVYADNNGTDSDIAGNVLDLNAHTESNSSGPGSGGDSSNDGNSGSGSRSHGSDEATALPSPELALSFALVDFDTDLIHITAPCDGGAAVAATTTGGLTEALYANAPTASDVASLEAYATASNATDGSNSNCNTSSSSNSGSDSSQGSGSGAGSSDLHDLSSISSSGKGSEYDDGDNNPGSGNGHGGSNYDHTADNDNGGDGALGFASGYGNDIGDYMTAEEQAALVPEPISILFEALQFANAFSDTANDDVMIFDGSNVVTISQLRPLDQNDPRFDGLG